MRCCTCKTSLPDGRRNRYCTECSRQRTIQWRERNPERWREIKNASSRKRHSEDPERRNASSRAAYSRDRDTVLAKMRAKVHVKCASCGRDFEKPQTHNRCSTCSADRSARRRAIVMSGERIDFAAVSSRSGGLCAICGQVPKSIHWDHIIPISRGGPHVTDNLQLTCARCNQSKGAKMPEGVMFPNGEVQVTDTGGRAL